MSTSDNTQALLTLMQTLGVDPAEVLALMTSGNAGGATPSVSVNDFVNNSGQTPVTGEHEPCTRHRTFFDGEFFSRGSRRIVYLIKQFKQAEQSELDTDRSYTITHVLCTSVPLR